MMRKQVSTVHVPRIGAALVEMALTLPVLLLMVAGFLELARVSMLKHTADAGAYEGARAAVVAGALADDARVACEALLESSRVVGATVRVSPDLLTESTTSVTVEVELPVARNTWIPPFFFQSASVKSSVTLLTERPAAVQLSAIESSQGLGLGVSAVGLGL